MAAGPDHRALRTLERRLYHIMSISGMIERTVPELVEDATVCLLYTSDAADDMQCVDLGGRRIIKKKKTQKNRGRGRARRRCCCFFFFKQKTAYEIGVRLVGSEMCIRDSSQIEQISLPQNFEGE